MANYGKIKKKDYEIKGAIGLEEEIWEGPVQ